MKRILSLLALFWLLVSCDYLEALNPEPQMTFSIDLSKSVTVEAEGGKISIPLESNSPWQASFSPATGVWFVSLLKYKGEAGSGTLEFEVRPNLLSNLRAGVISLRCVNRKGVQTYEISIAQLAAEPFARILDWDEPVIPAEGGSLTLRILTNCPWGYTVDNADVTLVEIKEPAVLSPTDPPIYELTLAVAKNPGTVRRTFLLNLTNRFQGSKTIATYTFYQAG